MARGHLNGAWKSHLKNKYGRHQLGLAFLECPSTMVDTLLNKWKQYMQSKEYNNEVQRSKKGRAGSEKNAVVAAKIKVYQLKHERRRAVLLIKQLQADSSLELSKWDKQVYKRYQNGDIDKELDDAKCIHGYGILSTGEVLGPSGPRYTDRIRC